MKKWLRKRIVGLKRNTFHIPLLMIVITCLVFNFYLTDYSDTIADINVPGMGLCLFVTELCSFLSIISFLTAFPRRQKVKLLSVILVIAMLVLSIVCQALLLNYIHYGLYESATAITLNEENTYVLTTINVSIVHIVLLGISIISIATMPLYHKALMKIDTSVAQEEIKIEKIDLSDDN